MTTLNAVSEGMRTFLLFLLFFEAAGEIAQMMRFKARHSGRRLHILPGCIIVLILLALLMVCLSRDPAGEGVPLLLVAAAVAGAAVHMAAEAVTELLFRKEELSPYAIKEATDDLPSGVCFTDASGRVILCNRTMGELSSVLIGSYPQTAQELETALFSPAPESGVKRMEGEPVLYHFPDKRVWRFRVAQLDEPAGFHQFIAQDVTAISEINEKLSAENEELRNVNEKLRAMYERLADRIRVRETLDLKMRIHNNIGTSLIAVSEMIQDDSLEDMESRLAILRDAVSYLSDDRMTAHGTFDEVKRRAADMKVSLVLRGSLPQNAAAEALIVAAARECVTNCVRHAGGHRVTVEVSSQHDIFTVTITNDGRPPEGGITEGGGLSTLRRRVEEAGGEMYIACRPAFALILNLP